MILETGKRDKRHKGEVMRNFSFMQRIFFNNFFFSIFICVVSWSAIFFLENRYVKNEQQSKKTLKKLYIRDFFNQDITYKGNDKLNLVITK